jgi:hypothetical protein
MGCLLKMIKYFADIVPSHLFEIQVGENRSSDPHSLHLTIDSCIIFFDFGNSLVEVTQIVVIFLFYISRARLILMVFKEFPTKKSSSDHLALDVMHVMSILSA